MCSSGTGKTVPTVPNKKGGREMTTKKLAIILIGVVFIAFGVGFFALNFLGNKTGENIFNTNNFP